MTGSHGRLVVAGKASRLRWFDATARRGFILFSAPVRSSRTIRKPANQSTRLPRCNQRADIVGKPSATGSRSFSPDVPVGSSAASQCALAGRSFRSKRGLGTQVAAAEKVQNQRAITLYNSLRNSPANSITLNELMTMYAHMGEYDQAISAARDFPQALNNSEQCMTTLGRVYLARNNFPEAIQWFDAATTRNETLGEAHYYKAWRT
jgi:tetratricopeptide (TPR) repeat protein